MTPAVGDRVYRRDRPRAVRLVTYVDTKWVILLNLRSLTFRLYARRYIETRWERSQ